MLKDSLSEDAGLTNNESTVYLALLKIGSGHVGEIAKSTGLHRRTIYDCLERLREKGFVGVFLEGKTHFYSAADPKILVEAQLSKLQSLEKLLPELALMGKHSEDKINVTVFRSKEGIKSTFEDLLQEKPDCWYNLISSGVASKFFSPQYIAQFHNRRISAGIQYKVIYYKGAEAERRAREQGEMGLTELRHLDYDASIPISTWIYGKKVAFVVWEASIGIIVESEKVANAFRRHFQILWKIAKK